MILKYKAKEDFLKWYFKAHHRSLNYNVIKESESEMFFMSLHKVFQATLITEWLDSVGIYIDTHHSYSFDDVLEYCAKVSGVYVSHGIKDKPINRFDSRQEATKAAIERANEIYNTQHFAQ